MNKYILLVVIASVVILNSCYTDEMILPEPDFEIFTIDKNKNEVMVENTVYIGETVYFRNKGIGNAFVIWPGERALSKGYGFKLTNEAVFELTNSNELPKNYADAISDLVGISFASDRDFKKELQKQIPDDDLKIFENNIYNSSFVPFKDINENDSVLFKYNYSHNDFVDANDKGYYNVSGLPLIKDADNNYVTQYKYTMPGKRTVTFQSVGIGNFGKNTKTETITKTFEVVVMEK
jgi:hypothetical protein